MKVYHVITKLLLLSVLVMVSIGCQGREQGTGEGNRYLAVDTVLERRILGPNVPYRILSENDRVSNIIDPLWHELLRIDGGFGKDIFMLNVANYQVDTVLDANGEVFAEIIVADEETELLLNLPGMSIGPVWDYPIERGVLFPGDTVDLYGEDDDYKVVASGTRPLDISRGKKGSFRLDFYEGEKLILPLIDQSEYDDSKTEIHAILDLNYDEKPDFILSSPRHAQEHRIIIWLSGETYMRYEEVVEKVPER